MEIVGLIARALPANRQVVTQRLRAITGLEIHHFTTDGRFILTVETPTHQDLKDALNQLESVDGLLSRSVVYQYSDEIEDANVETQS